MTIEVSTNPTPPGADVDPADAIADLLGAGEPEGPEGDLEDLEGEPADPEGELEDPEGEPADDDDDDDEPADDDDDDGIPDGTLNELLGLSDTAVTVDEATGQVNLGIKVDGVESSVGLKEVVAGYQTAQYNTQKSQGLANQRKHFEGQVQIKANEIQQGLELNATLLNQLQQELMSDYNRVDWETLRVQDPAEYAARQQDQSARYNQLQNLQQGIQQQYGASVQQQQQQEQQVRGQHLQQQRAIMMTSNPTWQDKNVMQAEMAGIRDFLAETYGLPPEAISNVVDASSVAIVQDAMAYRKGKKAAVAKVKKAPRILKSRGVKKSKMTKLAKLTKAAKNAKGSSKRDLEASAIAEILGG